MRICSEERIRRHYTEAVYLSDLEMRIVGIDDRQETSSSSSSSGAVVSVRDVTQKTN